MFFFELVQKLNQQLDQWLNAVNVVHNPAKAIISPYYYYFCLIVIILGFNILFLLFKVTPATSTLDPALHFPISRLTLNKCINHQIYSIILLNQFLA